MSKRYFVLVLGALLLCLSTVVASGDWSHLKLVINIPSLIIMLVLPFLLSLSSFSWRQGTEAFRVSFIHVPADKKQLREAQVFFGALGRYYFVTALFGFFSGVIAMLVNLGGPGNVGSNFALALLVVFYALMLELLVVLPFATGVKKKLAALE